MESIHDIVKNINQEIIDIRRDIHKYPELGFCEFKTAYKIITYLKNLNFDVQFGQEVLIKDDIIGAPSDKQLKEYKNRAIKEGVPSEIADKLDNCMTAIVATLDTKKEGKTIAFRFDMDANEISESKDLSHRPNKENFASLHEGVMHACGHDGHTAIGLGLAKTLFLIKEQLVGKIKLIFQPAEEGVRGANAMINTNILDDVDYFFSGHIGINVRKNNVIVASTKNFLASSKFIVKFKGLSSHAGLSPEKGKNALLAACQATLGLYSISQHGKGMSKVNVGILNSGTAHNTIADFANLTFQTRGQTNQINSDVIKKAKDVIYGAAKMYDCDVDIELLGSSMDYIPNNDFSDEIYDFINKSNLYEQVIKYGDMNASEDCTAFLNKVSNNNKKGIYMMYGAKLANEHHNPNFDFDESVLSNTCELLALLAKKYTHN